MGRKCPVECVGRRASAFRFRSTALLLEALCFAVCLPQSFAMASIMRRAAARSCRTGLLTTVDFFTLAAAFAPCTYDHLDWTSRYCPVVRAMQCFPMSRFAVTDADAGLFRSVGYSVPRIKIKTFLYKVQLKFLI